MQVGHVVTEISRQREIDARIKARRTAIRLKYSQLADEEIAQEIPALEARLIAELERVLDFDIENRPLSYLGQDFTTAEITSIAASWGPGEPVKCWLLGIDDPGDILTEFCELYDQADMVTGHYIRMHDLPMINSGLMELHRPLLGPKLTCDTKLDLRPLKGASKSQESLSDMLGVPARKVGMSQAMWRSANRLTAEGIALTRIRVEADVRQHQALRLELLKLGALRPPKVWGR